MSDRFNSITIEGPNSDVLFEMEMPMRLVEGGLFLCQSGTIDIVIDMKQYRIEKGDLVVAFPFSLIQIHYRSEDFKGFLISTDINFFETIQIPNRSSYFLYIKENPCISLTEEEGAKLLFFYETLLNENKNQAHPLRNEIDECLLKIIAYEIAAAYLRRKPINQQQQPRKEMIFHQFIFSLFNNYREHRSLEFYATEQSITPRYLSMIVKQVSGQTAAEWISRCVIMNMKTRLQDITRSIQEIAEEMNFPNPSFFAQYFRKYTGLTPKGYRETIHHHHGGKITQ